MRLSPCRLQSFRRLSPPVSQRVEFRLSSSHSPKALPSLAQAVRGASSEASSSPQSGASPVTEGSSSTESATDKQKPYFFHQGFLGDAEEEVLSPEEKAEKEQLVKLLAKKLAGPLADENGNVPTGDDRPIAIEVDGPSHFYSNSSKYTAYTKLKHRLLTRMGYKVVHVPYFEWRRLRGAREREEYMRRKLLEEPSEWLDPEDEAFYKERISLLRKQYEEEERLRAQSQKPAIKTDFTSGPSTSSSAPRAEQSKPQASTFVASQTLKCDDASPPLGSPNTASESPEIPNTPRDFASQTDTSSERAGDSAAREQAASAKVNGEEMSESVAEASKRSFAT